MTDVPVQQRPCPQCGEPAGSTLACLHCGAVLEEPEGSHHFARLGLGPKAVLDADELEARYLKLSRLLHPDYQGGAGAEAQARAVAHSAALNEAYRTLRDEQSRHEYLLELFHPGSLEKHKQLDPAFLMEAMEVNEELEQAREDGCADTVQRIATMARREIDERMQGVAAACSDTFERIANADAAPEPADDERSGAPRPLAAHWDTEEIATLLHQARVYRRILRDAKDAPRTETT